VALQKVPISGLVTKSKRGAVLALDITSRTAVITEEVALLTEDALAVRIAC